MVRQSFARIKKIIKLLKGLVQKFVPKAEKQQAKRHKPTIIPRAEHGISRKDISSNALKVLYRLHQAGYETYLVGGCVRDLLLGRKPKDFDVATSARPEEVRRLFKNCMLIGRRFRLAHIMFGKEIIEVATFRTHHQNASSQQAHTSEGMIIRDNVFGEIEDDALRRDFTINALYYNIADFSVVDFLGGMKDIGARCLRIIGDPLLRYQEDPVRLIRIVRFAGKLRLNISPETEAPIIGLSHLLEQVSPARLYLEVLKFFQEGATAETLKLLQKYHLLKQLFPQTAAMLNQPGTSLFIHNALINTDQRLKEGKTISPAFLFTVFMWPAIIHEINKIPSDSLHYGMIDSIIQDVIQTQKKHLDIPRRLLVIVREICMLQYRFAQRRGKQPYRLLEHPRFRAAYDLLLLRAESNEPIHEISDWWVKFYSGDTSQREKLLKQLHKEKS